MAQQGAHKEMGLMRWARLVAWLIIILSMYIVPYTILREHKGIGIYLFWTAIAILAIVLAWVGVSRWTRA